MQADANSDPEGKPACHRYEIIHGNAVRTSMTSDDLRESLETVVCTPTMLGTLRACPRILGGALDTDIGHGVSNDLQSFGTTVRAYVCRRVQVTKSLVSGRCFPDSDRELRALSQQHQSLTLGLGLRQAILAD